MYKALYRKWRPMSFDDVISQKHITITLRNQIKNEKTAHAYLFTGSRGTGKTTCARIFAKAVNCLNPMNGNPCLECEICRDAENSALADIIEIDAASNNSVDDVRELREGAVYTPERCRYKIYIIDEVHMLSQSAFNALLKIMEEPPEYVKFILATTEIHKVPATIASRCQRFDFKRIEPHDISERLLYIAGKEGLDLHDDASFLIASAADGGMRDAVSLLDQCSAYGDEITTEIVSMAAGIASRQHVFKIINALVNRDATEVLGIVAELYSLSKDMQRLCDELVMQFRNIMLLKVNPKQTDIISCMPDEIKILLRISETLELSWIISSMSSLQSCGEKMIRAVNKRTELEMTLITICVGQNDGFNEKSLDNSDIYDKINKLEEKISQINSVPKVNSSAEKNTSTQSAQPVRNSAAKPDDFSKLNSRDFKPLSNWAEVLNELQSVLPAVSGCLADSSAFVNGNFLLIVAKNRFFLTLFKNKENASMLGDAVKKVLGKHYEIRARCSEPEQNENKTAGILEKAQSLNIDYSVDSK